MLSQLYIPHPALQDFVISIIAFDGVLPDGVNEVVTPYPPTPHQSIIFYGNYPIKMQKEGWDHFDLQPSTVVIGPMYTRVNLIVTKRPSPRFVSARTGLELNGKKLARGDTSHGERESLASG